MTVMNLKPDAESCDKGMDPFLSQQDSEHLLGRVLAGMFHFQIIQFFT